MVSFYSMRDQRVALMVYALSAVLTQGPCDLNARGTNGEKWGEGYLKVIFSGFDSLRTRSRL